MFDLEGRLTIDYSELGSIGPELQRVAADVKGAEATLPVTLDDSKAQLQAKGWETRANLLSKEGVKAKATLDTTPAKTSADDLRKWWSAKKAEMERDTVKLQATIDTTKAEQAAKAPPATAGGMGTGTQALIYGASALAAGFSAQRIISESMSLAATSVRMEGAVKRTFGTAADDMIAYLQKISDASGYMNDDLQQSAVLVSQMSDALGGFSADQVKKLVTVSAGIARTSVNPSYMDQPMEVAQALAYAIQGRSIGSKRLGVDVSDTYMRENYQGGALKDAWENMTLAAKEQARYNAIIEQTADVSSEASMAADDYAKSQAELTKAVREAEEAIGRGLLPIVKFFSGLVADIPKPIMEIGLVAGMIGSAAVALGLMSKGIAVLVPTFSAFVKDLVAQIIGLRAASGTSGLLSGGGLPGGGGGGTGGSWLPTATRMGGDVMGSWSFKGLFDKVFRTGVPTAAAGRGVATAAEAAATAAAAAEAAAAGSAAASAGASAATATAAAAEAATLASTAETYVGTMAGAASGGSALAGAAAIGGPVAIAGGVGVMVAHQLGDQWVTREENKYRQAVANGLVKLLKKQQESGVDLGLRFTSDTNELYQGAIEYRKGQLSDWGKPFAIPLTGRPGTVNPQTGELIPGTVVGQGTIGVQATLPPAARAGATQPINIQTSIVVRDQTTGGIMVAEAGSYAPSSY